MNDLLPPHPLSRRSFVRFLAAAPIAAATLQVAAAPTSVFAAPRVSTARPTVVRSFGPNGTHWPAHTPWIHDAVATIEVACSWDAIRSALLAVTASQAAAGVHIKVQPGTLPGLGASSGSKAVLQGLGSATWSRNVLVSPRDGWGTVSISGPARLREVYGVTFARINGVDVLLTNCTRSAWAQSTMSDGLSMASSYATTTRECGAYEIVMSNVKSDISDPLGYAAGAGCLLTDSVWEGCYSAPVFRPTGATDHVDTLQMYGTGWYRGLTVRDTTFFGSLNCALQIGGMRTDDPQKGTPFLIVDHSIVTSQATAIRARYPKPADADTPSLDQAVNGIGEDFQLYAKDSYFFGSLYRSKWGGVANTKVSNANVSTRNPVKSGAWTYDSAMSSWGAAQFDSLVPVPTNAYLRSIWQ